MIRKFICCDEEDCKEVPILFGPNPDTLRLYGWEVGQVHQTWVHTCPACLKKKNEQGLSEVSEVF